KEIGERREIAQDTNMANKTLIKLYEKTKEIEETDSPMEKIAKFSKKRNTKRSIIQRGSVAGLKTLSNATALNIQPEKSNVTFADLGGCEAQF
uniref:AAA+ ATPase domain-containing protein n=1 Tax=Parascaris univalens TaxID=6257 RepID=A0A915BJJ6_PARUN